MASLGWFNGGLPFFGVVLTSDGKTGRDCALAALKEWAKQAAGERRIAEACKYHRLNLRKLD